MGVCLRMLIIVLFVLVNLWEVIEMFIIRDFD